MEQIVKGYRTYLLDNYDLTGGDVTVDNGLLGHPKICLQAVWSGVVGTGVAVTLQQSNNGIDWDDMKTISDLGLENWGIDIASAAGSESIQDDEQFGGNHLRVVVANTAITAGILSLILNTY